MWRGEGLDSLWPGGVGWGAVFGLGRGGGGREGSLWPRGREEGLNTTAVFGLGGGGGGAGMGKGEGAVFGMTQLIGMSL